MNFSDLPSDVKEALDDQPEMVQHMTIGEIFDAWCNYQGLVNWGPRIRRTWLELQRIQSLHGGKVAQLIFPDEPRDHDWPSPLEHGDSCYRCGVTTDDPRADGNCVVEKEPRNAQE